MNANMKTNTKAQTLCKAALLTLVLTTSVATTSAYAGSKQKPPIAETSKIGSWYSNIVNFFSL